MESTAHEPEAAETGNAAPALITTASPFTRHDGWTGEKMAIFCETLAETAVVAEACEAARMGISGAYACRRRNPVFAAAWDAALTIARERLADTLLARSMEGNIEQIWRDGEMVGERHLLDNRLGLAILRRLDRLAETGMALHSNPAPFPGEGRGPGAAQQRSPAIRSKPFDWELAVNALRTGDQEAVCQALALFQGNKVEEVDDPLNRPPSPEDQPEEIDLSDRFWLDEDSDERVWMTDFPPPAGFTGYQNCDYGDPKRTYKRECTPEEVAVLEADAARSRAAERAEDEALRDEWLALLRAECSAADAENRRSSTKSGAEPASGSAEPNPTDVTEGAESNSPELRERPSVTLLRAESGETPPPATTHVDDVPQQV